MDNTILEKREDGKYKLIENILVKPSQVEKLDKLVEKVNKILYEGKEIECIGVYTFPVSKPGIKNLNERIYPKKLWENVIQKGYGEGSYGLMGHPENDGNPKDAWCVWRNLRFNESQDLVVVDAYLFGPYGKFVEDAMKAGGNVGLSTVGYGDFKDDGITIEESSYELARVADFVLDPSAGVFGSFEDKVVNEQKENSKKQLLIKNPTNINSNNTNIKTYFKEENTMSEKSQKLIEKNFRLYVENRFKEIQKLNSIKEKYQGYQELLENFDDDITFADDLKAKIVEAMIPIKAELDKLVDKGQEFDTMKESKEELIERVKELEEKLKDITEKFEKETTEKEAAIKILEELKVYTNKLRDLYEISNAEKNGMVTATEYKQLSVYTEKIEEELKKIKDNHTKAAILAKQKIEKVKAKAKVKEKENKKTVQEQEKKEGEKCKTEDDKEGTWEKDDDGKLVCTIKKEQKKEEAVGKEVEKETKKEESVKKETKKEENITQDFTLNLRNDEEVQAYYNDLLIADSRVEKIREDILKCKTLMEAQTTYLRLKHLYEENESVYDRGIKEDIQPTIRTIQIDNIRRKDWI